MRMKRVVLDIQKLEGQREVRQWSQKRWADFLGLSHGTYMKCLQRKRMSLNRLEKVAHRLGMDPVELLTVETVEV